MRIPDQAECYKLMEQHGMLDNIRAHSLTVARLSEEILTELQANPAIPRPLPDQRLVIAGALLHDIAKTLCLDESCNHALLGAEMCRDSGYPEVADIVEEHVLLPSYDSKRYSQGYFTAREIVYYADKRVRHDEVVTLDKRLEYILTRYGKNDPKRHALICSNFNKCLQLEEHLFSWLSITPEKLGCCDVEQLHG
ncbi:HDIG domain-containing metalloprotein [Desulfogranum japonicum]|uniref:HDIG domain-containing metalloprotein n=1 Tax=Desulfogranum japonicum TaxID=231447 RepID=UPI0003F96485|nr:HDIG domain-containing metalloprotein [Desulfogranum japonicum]